MSHLSKRAAQSVAAGGATLAAVLTAACSSVPEGNPLPAFAGSALATDAAPPAFDPAPIFAAVAGQAYQTSDAFVQASVSFPSAAAPGQNVIEWVSKDALPIYQMISPDEDGSEVTMPTGSIIVRAVQDPTTKAIQKLTLLAKGPPGYNPALGDWWFGEADPNGVPVPDGDAGFANGIPWEAENCYSCHTPRASDDFLFGVSKANRPPPTAAVTGGSSDGG